MEFKILSVLALFCLAVVSTDASQSAKDYWQSVWPNTPLPEILSDLLLPDSKTNIPIRVEEEKQYWTIFFEQDLYPGKIMTLGLNEQSKIPTLSSRARRTSQPFGINTWWDSKESQLFETKRRHGNIITREKYGIDDFYGNPAAIGEDKHCALSLDSMMDFAISKLGSNIKVVSSFFPENHDEYAVEEIRRIGDKVVMCHRLNFEKVVFYCHQVNATTTYMVPLVASDGTRANALTICHHDTRGMNPDLLYETLKVYPGTVPVCHFVGNKAIAWVPNRVKGDSDKGDSDARPCVL